MRKSPEELIKEFKQRGDNEKIEPATDDERDRLRDEYPEVCKLPGKASQARCLHIPDEDQNPICKNHINNQNREMGDREYVVKDVDKYHKGWLDWCKQCVRHWRDDDE